MDLPSIIDTGELVGRDVDGLTEHVEHVAEHSIADGHRDAAAGVAYDGAALEPVRGAHADDAHPAVTDLLRDLGGDEDRLAVELNVEVQRGVDLRQRVGWELDVDPW